MRFLVGPATHDGLWLSGRTGHNAPMDIAVNLVETYLRLNGYLTLSEFEIQQKGKGGQWHTVTDVDMVAVRFPGSVYAGDAHTEDECRFLTIDDDALQLEPDTIDIIIGEVKQGEAVFNPGLTSHAALHTVLARFDWVFAGAVGEVIDRLQSDGVSHDPARHDGSVRTRLVAFGRAPETNLNTMSLTHIFESIYGYMDRFERLLHGAQFKEPAPALLHLLQKTGFRIGKD